MSEPPQRIPSEPIGTPTLLRDGYEVYIYENKDDTDPLTPEEYASVDTPDSIYIVERPEDVHLRMWAFVTQDGLCFMRQYIWHQFSPEESVERSKARECCHMVIPGEPDTTHPGVEGGLNKTDLPSAIESVIIDVSDMPVVVLD